jgi:hypothetical protein
MLAHLEDYINNSIKAKFPEIKNYGLVRVVNEKGRTYPAINHNGVNMQNLLPDVHSGTNYSFIKVLDGYSRQNEILKASFDITFFRKMENQTIEAFRDELETIFKAAFYDASRNYFEEPKNVYNGYTHKIEHNQFNLPPYYAIRVRISDFSFKC